MSTIEFIISLHFCVAVVIMPVSCSETMPPGLVIRVPLPGLNYVAQKEVMKFASQINGSSDFIPDSSEATEIANVSIRNVTVTDFVTGKTNVSIDPGNGIICQIDNARISLTAFLDCLDGPVSYSDDTVDGNLKVDTESMSVTIKSTVGITSDGRPIALLLGCSTSVDNVRIVYHKNVFCAAREFVEITFLKTISDAVCRTASEFFTKRATALLGTLKLTETVQSKFIVDNHLVETPHLYPGFVETDYKAEFRSKGDIFGSSFLPSEIDLPKTAPSMINFYVSEYSINTCLEAMFRKKYFAAIVKKQDLPTTNQSILSTACGGGISFGCAFPDIPRRYPNDSTVLSIRAIARPVLTISNNSADLKVELEICFLIKADNVRNISTVILHLMATTVVNASVVGNKLAGELGDFNSQIINITGNATSNDYQHSLNPDLNILNRVLKSTWNLFIAQKLNEAAAIGIPLPTKAVVDLVKPDVTTIQHAFVVTADFKYKREP